MTDPAESAAQSGQTLPLNSQWVGGRLGSVTLRYFGSTLPNHRNPIGIRNTVQSVSVHRSQVRAPSSKDRQGCSRLRSDPSLSWSKPGERVRGGTLDPGSTER
jgi:hypothetical protein